MNIYLKHLVAAFYLVDRKYYSNSAYSSDWREFDDITVKEYTQYIERVFAYELYHQFRGLMERFPLDYRQLVFNGKIGKNGFKKMFDSNTIFPDFVLHRSQGSLEMQRLFIEIKTRPNVESKLIFNDLDKILISVGELLKFDNGVFICIGPYKFIKNDILDWMLTKDQDDRKLFKKLWLINDKIGLINFLEIKFT